MTAPHSLMSIQAERQFARATYKQFLHKIHTGELVSIDKLDAATFTLARRIRDQLLSAPARHAAILAAQHGLDPGAVANALEAYIRSRLKKIADQATSP